MKNSKTAYESNDDDSDHSVSSSSSEESTVSPKSSIMETISLTASEMEKAIENFVSTKTKQNKEFIESNSNKKKRNMKNALSDLIPGYVAPMSLDSSSLDIYKKRISSNTGNNNPIARVPTTGYTDTTSKNFKMAKPDPSIRARKETNAGSGWFGFQATPNSASLQADIAIIRNRNYLDPKKFYKSSDFGKKGEKRMVQLGTVIEGSMESIYSNRLSKKQRKNNVLEEVMGEVFHSKDDYVKKKYTKMQREKSQTTGKRNKNMISMKKFSKKHGKR